MSNQLLAKKVIEKLRSGIPPQRGTALYSVGYEKLIEGIQRHHLSEMSMVGKIRFISGSWGAGKTHFFHVLREVIFKQGCLVSNVEVSKDEAPLNKFERVFYAIVRNITTPSHYETDTTGESAPFGSVLHEALITLGHCAKDANDHIAYEPYTTACEKLMADKKIDIDFKKIVQEYWKTYLREASERVQFEKTRAEILQWFAGEGTIALYRKRFGVNKMVSRQNAKPMLQSLAEFVRLAGYNGLTILFDETEKSFSVMRRSALKDAHNNLLSLINGIESLPGMFLIYATTPDFYTDTKHGIVIFGALSGRIGKPGESPPKALDTIWNLDAVTTTSKDYQEAAKKIRSLYLQAYPEVEDRMLNEEEMVSFVKELQKMHGSFSTVRFWRALVAGLVKKFDNLMEGEDLPTKKLYIDVMDQLRKE